MEAISILSLFLMGVAYGSSACMLSCSPILAPLLVHHAGSLRQSVRMVALFSAGRILSYVALATAASFATAGLREVLADPREARYLMGTIMVLTALWLLYRQFHETSHRCAAGSMFSHIGALGPLGTFVMGALLSVNLCAPLLSLLSVASATGSPWQGALFGLAFGMGSVLVSLFFYGFVLAAISKELLFQFKRQKVYIESVASALLLVAGVMVATGHLKL